MKAIAQRRETAGLDMLVGKVLCHDVRDGSGKVVVDKGARLDTDATRRLLEAPWQEIHLIALEPGDLHEEEAGARLAAAVVGDGVAVKGYTAGQWTLVATRRGVLRIRRPALEDVNVLEGISVFTLFDLQPVESGETVAKCKVTPLVVPGETLAAVEQAARAASGLVAVEGFRRVTVGAVAQQRLDDKQRSRFEAALTQKLGWFGSALLPVRYATGSARMVADELGTLAQAGAEVLIVAGASALDPLDPVFGGLTLLGARMERHGAPAHPGSLLWLAFWEGRPVLGMPTCGMFSQATTFDLVLPRILAGERIDNRAIAELGHGGLLSRDLAYRFPPYRANAARGELDE
jgi:hypothetical protein